jgi:hypothetical protein
MELYISGSKAVELIDHSLHLLMVINLNSLYMSYGVPQGSVLGPHRF